MDGWKTDLLHLIELEIVVGKDREHFVGQFDAGIRALEIEAGGNFLVGLVHGVVNLDLVDFGNDVERGHGERGSEWMREKEKR